MKMCFKCNEEKPLSEFYKHSQMGDGYLNKCKECTKKDVKAHRNDNLERIREYDRNRPNALERSRKHNLAIKEKCKDDPEYKAKRNAFQQAWLDRNTVKRAAYIITGNAIRDGKLIRSPCEVCDENKVEAHHDDYEKPLDVRWLCKKHHMEFHKELRRLERQL